MPSPPRAAGRAGRPAGGRGVTAGVQLNQNTLVPAATVTTSAGDPISVDTVSVAAGDALRFEVGSSSPARHADDLTSVVPSIAFTQTSALGDTSFEVPALFHSTYSYQPTGSAWTFGNQTG